jgi:hypothetical protein
VSVDDDVMKSDRHAHSMRGAPDRIANPAYAGWRRAYTLTARDPGQR